MIGIVIVSHSKLLGDELIHLCSSMKNYSFNIINGGGSVVGDIGTDSLIIKASINRAQSGNGVIILCDLGSSIFNTLKSFRTIK